MIISKNRIILILIVLCLAFIIWARVQYNWVTELNYAIHNDDAERIEELLNDKTKIVNFKGRGIRGHFSKETPLEVACYKSHSDIELMKSLIDRGAIANADCYYSVVFFMDCDINEKVKLLIDTGGKPIVYSDYEGDLLIELAEGMSLIDFNDSTISKQDMETRITEAYKLIYYNAEPFDKASELNESLKYAKEQENKTLVTFIESELLIIESK